MIIDKQVTGIRFTRICHDGFVNSEYAELDHQHIKRLKAEAIKECADDGMLIVDLMSRQGDVYDDFPCSSAFAEQTMSDLGIRWIIPTKEEFPEIYPE